MDIPARAPFEALPAGALRRLPRCRGLRLVCVSGLLWVTEAGCADDRFLTAGEDCTVGGDGLVIVEALTASTLLRIDGRKKTRRAQEGEGEPSAGAPMGGRNREFG